MISKTDRAMRDKGVPSIISAKMSVTGNLSGDGVMQVDGTVEGDILCAELTLGETAQVRGDIECDTVYVHGSINGEICARSVNLSATARVTGDIQHEELSIEAGAHLEGRLLRREVTRLPVNLVVGETD